MTFRTEISQPDIHADAMRRLHANPAVRQEAPTMTTHTPDDPLFMVERLRAAADTPESFVMEDLLPAAARMLSASLADNARLRDALTGSETWFAALHGRMWADPSAHPQAVANLAEHMLLVRAVLAEKGA